MFSFSPKYSGQSLGSGVTEGERIMEGPYIQDWEILRSGLFLVLTLTRCYQAWTCKIQGKRNSIQANQMEGNGNLPKQHKRERGLQIAKEIHI